MSERVPNVLLDFGTAVWSLPLSAMLTATPLVKFQNPLAKGLSDGSNPVRQQGVEGQALGMVPSAKNLRLTSPYAAVPATSFGSDFHVPTSSVD